MVGYPDEQSTRRITGYNSSQLITNSSLHSISSLPTLRGIRSLNQLMRPPSAEARQESLARNLESLVEEDNGNLWQSDRDILFFRDDTDNK